METRAEMKEYATGKRFLRWSEMVCSHEVDGGHVAVV